MALNLKISSAVALIAGTVMCACASASADDRSAARAERADAVLADYALTGEARSCLSLRSVDDIDPLDDNRWLIRMRNGDLYLNEVSRGCRQAASNFTYLQYRTTGGSLCANEIVQVIDRGTNIHAGACGLNDFQRLEPVADAS